MPGIVGLRVRIESLSSRSRLTTRLIIRECHKRVESGYFDRSLNVYGRTEEPCRVCGTPIRRIVVGGRGTHFCPTCQRKR